MDEAILYDLIAAKTIYKWREEVENEDCNIRNMMLKERDSLYEAVDESKRELVNRFKLALENYLDYIYFCVDVKLINTCIKIGMELQKFFDDNDE